MIPIKRTGIVHAEIVVTIATFNAYFGLLMYFSGGRSIYSLPDWWTSRVILFEHQSADGTWSELTLPFAVMVVCVGLTWALIRRRYAKFWSRSGPIWPRAGRGARTARS